MRVRRHCPGQGVVSANPWRSGRLRTNRDVRAPLAPSHWQWPPMFSLGHRDPPSGRYPTCPEAYNCRARGTHSRESARSKSRCRIRHRASRWFRALSHETREVDSVGFPGAQRRALRIIARRWKRRAFERSEFDCRRRPAPPAASVKASLAAGGRSLRSSLGGTAGYANSGEGRFRVASIFNGSSTIQQSGTSPLIHSLVQSSVRLPGEPAQMKHCRRSAVPHRGTPL